MCLVGRYTLLNSIQFCRRAGIHPTRRVESLRCGPARALLFRRSTHANAYGAGSVKLWKTRRLQNIRGYTDIFCYTAYSTESVCPLNEYE